MPMTIDLFIKVSIYNIIR